MNLKLRKKTLIFVWVAFLAFSINANATDQYNITTASVYESSSNVIGSGTPKCTNVNIDTAPGTCGNALERGHTYRFEFVVTNIGDAIGTPVRADFQDSIVLGNVLGETGYSLVSCGCNDNPGDRAGTIQAFNTDIRCTSFAAPACTISPLPSPGKVFYFIATVGTDGVNDSATYFYIRRLALITDTSQAFTLNVANYCGNGVFEPSSTPPVGGEQCDLGAQNTETACTPPYGGQCTYCDTSCINHIIQYVPEIVCGDGIVQSPELCDTGADQSNGVCFSNECSQSCACIKNSTGLKIAAIRIAPGASFIAGNAPLALDANVFVNDTNRSNNNDAKFDYNVSIFNTADNRQVAEISYNTESSFSMQTFVSSSPTAPIFIINLNPQSVKDKFKALPAGSYRLTVQIKRDFDKKVVAQRDAFFSITSSVSPIAVSETSPLLSVVAAFLVVGIILGKPVLGRLKLKR